MSKDLHNSERYLKELADNHKPVPPAMVWDEIEKELDKDQGKRRRFFMLWFFGIVISGVAIFVLAEEKNEDASLIVKQATSINNNQKQSDSPGEHSLASNSNTSNPAEAAIKTTSSKALMGQDEKLNEANTDIIETAEATAIRPIIKGQMVSASEVAPAAPDNHTRHHATVDPQQSPVKPQDQVNPANVPSTVGAIAANIDASPANGAVVSPEEDQLNPTTSTPPTAEVTSNTQVAAVQLLMWLPQPVLSSTPLPDPSDNVTATAPPYSENNTLGWSPWFVELGGGIGRNLIRPVLIEPTQGRLRLNTESSWYSWSTSMQVGYHFNNRWYTSVGFDLNQTKKRFDFWRNDINELVLTEDQTFQITNSDFFNVGEIVYTYADIGLSVGRRISVDKWHFTVEGGMIFNLLFDANGKVQVGAFDFSRLEQQEDYFKTHIGLGGRLSAMFDYPISDRLWLSAGPSYHQYFKSVSSDRNPLEDRTAIIQLKARVRYHF